MTWSYSGDPSDSDIDATRFRIGDTDTNEQQLQDEEITYLLTQEGSVTAAAVSAVRGLIAKFSRKIDQAVGDVKYSYSQLVDHYTELLKKLESDDVGAVPAFGGGISKADKQTRELDTDRVQPFATRDTHKIPSYDPKTKTYYEDP